MVHSFGFMIGARRIPLVLAAVCALGVLATAIDAAPPASQEVRALWVLRTSLESPEAIRRMVASASDNGFNALFVQVRGRGDAYFSGGVERRAVTLASQPEGFDPLAETMARAKDAGLRVHAWVNVNLVSSAAELPASREHVIYQHPEWLMVPRELAPELRSIDVRSPEYLGRLARWTRANAATVEGLYVSPVHADALAHVAAIVADLVTRYAVDGVHLDYVRYPAADFDYGRAAVEAFEAEMRARIPPSARARVEALQALDPFAWPETFADDWRLFRQSRLTAVVARVRSTVKAARPGTLVSAAVVPEVEAAQRDKLQDWRTWIEHGFIDALCPMAYTPEPSAFAAQIAEVRALAAGRPVWAGIGAYRLSPRETIDHIASARRLGVDGIILFSYDSLISPPHGSEYLAAIGRAAFSGS
ncbi:MAG: glycoside hydrolase family 10 protein [Vicinamibacterales bacterium]